MHNASHQPTLQIECRNILVTPKIGSQCKNKTPTCSLSSRLLIADFLLAPFPPQFSVLPPGWALIYAYAAWLVSSPYACQGRGLFGVSRECLRSSIKASTQRSRNVNFISQSCIVFSNTSTCNILPWESSVPGGMTSLEQMCLEPSKFHMS